MRIAAAIHWYQQSAISMERAAETAGMSRAEFLAELARRRVDVFVVDEEDLARELDDGTRREHGTVNATNTPSAKPA
jgi:predicted HTH domain antitoxin